MVFCLSRILFEVSEYPIKIPGFAPESNFCGFGSLFRTNMWSPNSLKQLTSGILIMFRTGFSCSTISMDINSEYGLLCLRPLPKTEGKTGLQQDISPPQLSCGFSSRLPRSVRDSMRRLISLQYSTPSRNHQRRSRIPFRYRTECIESSCRFDSWSYWCSPWAPEKCRIYSLKSRSVDPHLQQSSINCKIYLALPFEVIRIGPHRSVCTKSNTSVVLSDLAEKGFLVAFPWQISQLSFVRFPVSRLPLDLDGWPLEDPVYLGGRIFDTSPLRVVLCN